jgi:cyclopropane-fatty-acyl-phospholipid synthase
MLADGGRLLNHAISRSPVRGDEPPPSPATVALRRLAATFGSSHPTRASSALLQRYVFPDGELHDVGETSTTLEEVGFEVRHVENLREHYARTLRHWVGNLHDGWDDAVALAGDGRARVWKLYMSACALAFERRQAAIHQILAVKAAGGWDARMPLRGYAVAG